jgi:branched-chain amino acid aminotransferase
MAAARDGWRAILARSRRSAVGLPSSIKSANRLDAILARLEADEAGVEEAILLSADGHVAEGTACNLFWRHGAGLRTPDLGVGILPGVTRGVVLEVADRLGIGVEEGRWPPETLREAPEAFVTMTSLGPVPLTTLDGRPFPGDRDVVPRVRDAYWSLVGEEAARDPIDGG